MAVAVKRRVPGSVVGSQLTGVDKPVSARLIPYRHATRDLILNPETRA